MPRALYSTRLDGKRETGDEVRWKTWHDMITKKKKGFSGTVRCLDISIFSAVP